MLPALLLAGAAHAAAAGPAHATRSGQAFGELESSLLQAVNARSADQAAPLLADDFQMIVAQEAAAAVPRDDWLDALRQPRAPAWTLGQLTAREFGAVAVVSFVLQPARGTAAAALFVVDTWQRDGAGWKLQLRHVAPAQGARRGIPGDAPGTTVIKKY